MQVDQSKLLDQLAYKDTTDTAKGIANYVASGVSTANKTGVSGFQKKVEDVRIRTAETVDMSNTTYLRPGTENEKTVADTFGEGGETAMSRYNEMAIISNTTSEEDLKEMQEDGFSIGDTDCRTIVTVTDKIKAALAKAGVDISEYGDTLSREQLEEITGNPALAGQIAAELKAQDLPATAENVADMADAAEKVGQLRPFKDGELIYLVKNKMSPTIENLYRAEYGTGISGNGAGGTELSYEDFAQLKPMVMRVIRDAKLTSSAETMSNSRFLLQNGVPLTAENLSYFTDLKELSGQLSQGIPTEEALSSMCDAIAEGGRPMNAMLIDGYSLRGRAADSAQVVADASEEDLAYVIAQGRELTIENLRIAENERIQAQSNAEDTGDAEKEDDTAFAAKQIVTQQGLALLTAKRQLEEVRLAMTSEANYALLKKGISIDTKPLVELVEDLKSQENQYYKALLARGGLDTEENVALFRETDTVVRDLKTAPAYVIKPGDPDTLRTLHQDGMVLKDRLEKANESYELLMTGPRKDLGDSIQKAFRNVDAILNDLDMDTSEANRRAVRILAYNRTELTTENIAQVKMKDEEVQRAFTNLTPKVTMEMIKKGINPLDMDMNELNRTAEDIQSELGDTDTERYQKYLWKLEKNNEITQEERSSYIGIYRLIAQVERADNAAIGSLLQQNAPITMRTLLTAVRTKNQESMDYRVDDSFSGVESSVKTAKIDDQILASYHRNCLHDAKEKLTPQSAGQLAAQDYEEMSPEQVKEVIEQAQTEGQEADTALEKEYLQGQMAELTDAMRVPEEIYEILERADIPDTMNNLLAVRDMIRDRNRMFETLWNADGAGEDAMDRIEEMKAQVLERFGEAVKSPKEMAEAQEALADVAEHVMDTMIIENDETGTLDLKALRLMNTQFSICAKQAKSESYMIPIQTSDGGVAGVSLKIVHGTKKKGMVDILFGSKRTGKVAATFEAKETGISGILVSDNEKTRKYLSEHLGQLAQSLQGAADGEKIDLRTAKVSEQEMAHYENRVIERQTERSVDTAEEANRNAAVETREEAGRNAAVETWEEADRKAAVDTAEEANRNTSAATGKNSEEYQVQTIRLYNIAENFLEMVRDFL